MTIFLEVAKAVIVEEIDKIIKNSKRMDQSIVNMSLTTLGIPRNLELANTKRALLEELKKNIQGVQDILKDETSLSTLQQYIETCKVVTRNESNNKGYNEGTTGPSLTRLKDNIDIIYKKMNEHQLLDVPHNTHPLHVFYYYAARYSAQKTVETDGKNLVQTVISNPNISVTHELTQMKEQILWQCIQNCETELTTLDKQHAHYDDNVKSCVLRSINQLLDTNKDACKQKTSLFFRPDFGLLHELMSQAAKKMSHYIKMDEASDQSQLTH